MEPIASRLDPKSSEFQANSKHHRALAEELRAKITRARQGGGAEARQRHEARGKLFVRARIDKLLDPVRRSWSFRPWQPTACMKKTRRVLAWSPASGE